MSSFVPAALSPKPIDLTKHVKYNFGMVLGVEDFNQEFSYLSERDRWLVRELFGYGVVSGLLVTVPALGQNELAIEPGVAVDPSGQLVPVLAKQCANLDAWVQARQDSLSSLPADVLAVEPINKLNATLSLSVVLSYRQCPKDDVPIPGDPCRSEDDSMAPSRLQDDFKLELRAAAVKQPEDRALRELFTWLRTHIVVRGRVSTLSSTEYYKAVRDYVAGEAWLTADPDGRQPRPPFFNLTSKTSFDVAADDLPRFFRALWDTWSQELGPYFRRTKWFPDWSALQRAYTTGDYGELGADLGTILLGKVAVPLARTTNPGRWRFDPTKACTLDTEERPRLLTLRMLQEWLTATAAQLPPPYPRLITAGTLLFDGSAIENRFGDMTSSVVTAASAGSTLLAVKFGGYDKTVAASKYVINLTLVLAARTTSLDPTFSAVVDYADEGVIIRIVFPTAYAAADLKTHKLQVSVTQLAP